MPTPNKGESQSAFIGRAVRQIMGEGREQKQALAIAYSLWRQHRGKTAKLFKEYYGDDPEDDYEEPEADETDEADEPQDSDGDGCDEWEGEDQLIDDLNFPVPASYREPGGQLIARSGTYGVGTFTNYKLFKDVTAQQAHAQTALGNEKEQTDEEDMRRAKEVIESQSDADIVKAEFWQLPFKISKLDNDKRQIFGWAYVSEDGGKLIVDKQGDIIPIEELEKAAYDYLLNSGDGGEMHERTGVMTAIESAVFTPEKAALGVKHDSGRYGWWVGFQVNDEALWKRLKKGDLLELSIGGESMVQHVESIETYQAHKDAFGKARGRRHARMPFRY